MKMKSNCYIIVSLLLIFGMACTEQEKIEAEAENRPFPILEGPYLGQKPPGLEAEIFAPGIVSTSGTDESSSFSADGKTFAVGYGGTRWGIAIMEEIDGRWTEPQVAPFSGEHGDFDLNFTPEGNKLLFSSMRADPQKKFHRSG